MTETPDERSKPPPGMTGIPPSVRRPTDPAEHARQSAHEWRDVAESFVQQRMRDLGIEEDRIGAVEHSGDGRRHAFNPDERTGVTCDPFGRLHVDSGVLNPSLADGFGADVSAAWAGARLRHRVDCVIAHEHEETKADHETAVGRAAETGLPIADEARHVLRLIAGGEKGRGR